MPIPLWMKPDVPAAAFSGRVGNVAVNHAMPVFRPSRKFLIKINVLHCIIG
jgi:hypothetical protein